MSLTRLRRSHFRLATRPHGPTVSNTLWRLSRILLRSMGSRSPRHETLLAKDCASAPIGHALELYITVSSLASVMTRSQSVSPTPLIPEVTFVYRHLLACVVQFASLG